METRSSTTILDLNDDCLRHVFEYLKRNDLVAVADVCCRFRQNAQAEFAHSKSKETKLEIGGLDLNTLLSASKVLRNFGPYIKVVWLEGTFDHETDQYYCEKSLHMLNQYCYGTLTELQVVAIDISENIEQLLRPLLQHLQILIFTCCKLSNVFLNTLTELAPELHELRLQCSYCYRSNDEMKQPVRIGNQLEPPKLEKIQYFACNIHNNTIEEFFQVNPQLKNIILDDCPYASDQIFESIAKYVPQIEAIYYKPRKMNDRFTAPNPIRNTNIKYFGQLKNLKSLALILEPRSTTYMLSVVRKIVAANISLEHLHLRDFDLYDRIDEFVVEISKLKNLKTLKLRNIVNLKPFDILRISTHLSELSEIYFSHSTKSMFTSRDLLHLVQNANKLQLFCCHDHWFYYAPGAERDFCIDADTFMQMVNAVQSRSVNIPLKICLDNTGYTSSVPDALIRAHKRTLSIAFSELSDKCY